MKKILFAIVILAAGLSSCGGGKSSNSSSSELSSSTSGLADGKWPAAIYDKYGIPEIETKGQIVYTQFDDTEGSYQYEVLYNGVTKEEMQAYVKKLQEKGFRLPKYTQERVDGGRRDPDCYIYLPEEKQDKRLRISFDFVNPMSFEYYADEPNPAFVVKKAQNEDEQDVIEYNFGVSLNPLKNKQELEGSIESLNLKAEDFAGIPNVRVVRLGDAQSPGMTISYYGDHQLTKESFEAVHKKVLDVLTAKGCQFQHAFSGKEMTAEELSAQGIHSYGVKLNDKQYIMLTLCDDRVGDFGGSIKFLFNKTNK